MGMLHFEVFWTHHPEKRASLIQVFPRGWRKGSAGDMVTDPGRDPPHDSFSRFWDEVKDSTSDCQRRFLVIPGLRQVAVFTCFRTCWFSILTSVAWFFEPILFWLPEGYGAPG